MNNSQKQFIEAYEKHSDALFRFCFFKLSDKERAKDLLQETFSKAWEYVSTKGGVDNLRAFLYKILSNLIIDEYRKRKPVDSLEDLKDVGFDPSRDDTASWMNRIDGSKAIILLLKIPEPYRSAIFMRYVQGLSLGEIAEITEENENAIAVRIHRGLDKLRKLYNREKREVK
ncbi:MAG: RNA polymerase sigma factor [bacterium]|nr:RNA polymerase sigma factor [bacterium]